MNRTEIIEQVRIALSSVLNKELTELDESTRLFDDLALDSTSVIELLMGLEDSIGLEIDPDDLEPEAFGTVGTLTDYVADSLAKVSA
ncbi:phosphopantetheine-binding protein [Streptomyces filamentosus]|uniref:Phosphopantetheine-binding protein n=1 Tax=Streptomyces filamentosus TaxID=67294 RepID=A0ABY4URI3_STRFL|nr:MULTISPECIES: phosphopantetheine-binding protein [Streptomyces]APS19059.1 phosphopantetheine-binding protein [Streptomyces sp. Tue 6075]ESU50285.1 phosphopantetheine-binding protein [Streptomyces sp. HCCB10043]MYR81673.1 acyl carrier protein [Streptomyces sp. SID5466]USC46867.1 phosphopantetheine-binding protein [Streptomyces filamentosus]